MLKVYMYRCAEHGLFDCLMEYEARNSPQSCPVCEVRSPRTWEQAGPMVMNAALPDGTRRFDHIRAKMQLTKERSAAKERGDWQKLEEVRSEIKTRKDRGEI